MAKTYLRCVELADGNAIQEITRSKKETTVLKTLCVVRDASGGEWAEKIVEWWDAQRDVEGDPLELPEKTAADYMAIMDAEAGVASLDSAYWRGRGQVEGLEWAIESLQEEAVACSDPNCSECQSIREWIGRFQAHIARFKREYEEIASRSGTQVPKKEEGEGHAQTTA